MITFKNCISNLNFNHILFFFILISFFYLKNFAYKLINLYLINTILLKKVYNKINSISNKNKKNYRKINKKLKINYKNIKKIKKILKSNNFKNISNIEPNKIIEVIHDISQKNNIVNDHSNCITVDVENEYEFPE